MGLLDRVKAQAKAGAERAAEKAREELEELQTKRELGQAYGDLGRKVFELTERGEIAHSELGETLERVKSLKAKLESASGSSTGAAAP